MDAVVFDLDGVVTDTANQHARAWKLAFDEVLRERAEGESFAGFDPVTEYRTLVDGRSRQDGARAFLESRGIMMREGTRADRPGHDSVWAVANRKNELFNDLLAKEGVRVFASTVELLRRLRAAGVRTGAVTASRNATRVLTAAGVADLFDVLVDGMDADALGLPGKPDPAMFLEAARRLHVSPDRAVVVEDAQAGVEAGRRGGFGLVIGIDRLEAGRALLDRGADLVVADLADLPMDLTR